MNNSKNSIIVKSSAGNYEVMFSKTIEDIFQNYAVPQNHIVICDKNIYEKYGLVLNQSCIGEYYLVEANEKEKTLDGIQRFCNWLIEKNVNKKTTIIAIGGGVVQDIATFTSHIYYRGVDLVFMPTTLLSQADSCIGAKCGINIPPFKNQLGVFHSPKKVLIVEEFLTSLPKKDVISGFGEILKLSVTGPNHFYSELCDYLAKFNFNCNGLLPIIQSSLLAKLFVIEEDEFEKDLRRILNYGHSFGHALESLTKNQVSHGLAVLFGMDLINFLGYEWGITNEKFYQDFQKTLYTYFSEFKIPANIDAEMLVLALKNDKKADDGFINFAIPIKTGKIIIHRKVIDSELIKLVQEYIDEKSAFRTP